MQLPRTEQPSFSVRLIEAGWLLLAIALPLSFNPLGRSAFELPKTLLLWIGIALMGAAWLVRRPALVRRSPGHSTLRTALSISVLANLLVVLASTLLSTNRLISAQGSYERMQGAITQFSYLALFLLLALELRQREQVRRIFAAVAWGSLPVVIYGLFQRAGLDLLQWCIDGGPVISTLGRANFVGAYLAFAIPFTLASVRYTMNVRQRAAYAALGVVQLAGLIATSAQAAWLGVLVGAAVMALAITWERRHHRLAAVGVLAALLALLITLIPLMSVGKLEGYLGARGVIWRATFQLVRSRPTLGHGLDTFSYAFTRVFPPELVYLQGRAVRVDRAHNLILDILSSTGAVGLFAYAVLVGTALWIAVRAFARSSDRQVRVLLTGGLAAAAGHLVETQFSFQTTVTAALFWLTLGIVVAPWTIEEPLPGAGLAGARFGAGPRRILAVVLLIAVVPTSLTIVVADGYAGRANRVVTFSEPQLEESIAAAERATRLWPWQSVYHQTLSWLHLQRARSGTAHAAEFAAAERSLDAARDLTPDDYVIWSGYGELYTEWGLAGERALFAQAEHAYRQAVALFPGSAMLYTGWGLLYASQGRLADAEALFHQAVSLDHTDAWAFQYLGDTQLARGNLDGAEASYYNALRWAPAMPLPFKGLGHLHTKRGELAQALTAYQHALDLSPNDSAAHVFVAATAWGLGQRSLACQTAKDGLALAPDNIDLLALAGNCGE